MLEIIKRKEGEKSQKEQIRVYGNKQISFNSFGHLAVRGINSNEEDVLVVFDKETSVEIIKFCQQTLKEINSIDDIPF